MLRPLRTRAPARTARVGASRFAVVAISLVALIVAMVSLPRLRELGLRENAVDAERVLRRIAEVLQSGTPPTLRDAVASDRILSRALVDGEWLDDGRLRCHGYLFELRASPAPACARAWPWQEGATGGACFATWSGDPAIYRHANAAGLASGLQRTPPERGDAGWVALR
ncbi:MAG: hypothetical protein EPO68_10925 [Planctomycetota bacterium]|nr:MAG: hypothetical protein EPO68_10925 [Planctomycetota bacterium]